MSERGRKSFKDQPEIEKLLNAKDVNYDKSEASATHHDQYKVFD